MTIAYDLRDLGPVAREWAEQHHDAARKACVDAALQAQNLYVRRTRKAKAVDTGRMSQSFKVTPTEDGADLSSDAPYFTVIDQGRRPRAPGPPLGPILQWVLRKRIVGGAERAEVNANASLYEQAVQAAQAIRRSIHIRGIEAREITTGTDAIAAVWEIFAKSVERAIARSNRPKGGRS